MKKKYMILITILLILIMSVYFGYKGFNLYKNVYNINGLENLNIDETININTKNETDYLSLSNINIKNDFKDFELNLNYIDDENKKEYVKNDDKNTIFRIEKTKFNFYEDINNEKWVQDILEEKNINNDLDLILYAVNNKDKKINIFSSIHEMKFYNLIYNNYIEEYPKFKNVKLISGDLKGFIIETKDIIRVYIIDGKDKYLLSFTNKDYFTYEYIKELLNTIKIEKEFTKITINDKEMNIDKSKYDTLKGILEHLDYQNTLCNTDKVEYIIEIEGNKYFYNRHFNKVTYNNKCADLDGNNLYNSEEILTFVYSDNEMNNVENVKMKIKEGSLTNTNVTIVITDTNEIPYMYGLAFRIDVKENGIWKKVKIKEEVGIPLIGYNIGENNKLELNQDWELLYGPLEPGEYRLVKSVCADEGCYELKYFSVQFTIIN